MARYRFDDAAEPASEEGWSRVAHPAADATDTTKEARALVERAIVDVLTCEHVLVVAGLGTSLCIPSPENPAIPLFPTMSSLWTNVKTRFGEAAFDSVKTAVSQPARNNIEELLSRCHMRLALEGRDPGDSEIVAPSGASTTSDLVAFVKTAEQVIREECGRTLSDGATAIHEDFLRRLSRRNPRRPRVNIFTTNYDLCFETAASRIGLPLVDGFSYSSPPVFQPEIFDYDIVTKSSYSAEPDYISRLIRLFKLHGSVDWHAAGASFIKKPDTTSPLLIYPQIGKYAASYSPPFLEIMSRYQGLLRQPSVGVLVLSCGFEDRHVAEPLLAAVKSNASLRLVICAPDLCKTDARTLYNDPTASASIATKPFLIQCDQLIEQGDARISLLNARFPDFVRLMPSLPVKTDADAHEERIKKLERQMQALKIGQSGNG